MPPPLDLVPPTPAFVALPKLYLQQILNLIIFRDCGRSENLEGAGEQSVIECHLIKQFLLLTLPKCGGGKGPPGPLVTPALIL